MKESQKEKHRDREIDRQIDRQTDRQTDRQANRQTAGHSDDTRIEIQAAAGDKKAGERQTNRGGGRE